MEPEAIANLRRQKNTVLTEDNLKKYLNSETLAVNLENHYWVSNSFISKIAVLAPNLKELCLRRMPQITNRVFATLFEKTSSLTAIDFSDCTNLYSNAFTLCLRQNLGLKKV